MKHLILVCLCFVSAITAKAWQEEFVITYPVHDSVKAAQVMAEIKIIAVNSKKEVLAGIRSGMVTLALEAEGKDREFVMKYPADARVMAKGVNVDEEDDHELEWDYKWALDEAYKLMLATASDSAGNFIIYSGYIFLPRENKWKLIGTCRIDGRWGTIQEVSTFTKAKNQKKLANITAEASSVWLQRSNGSWKSLNGDITKTPVVNVVSHLDSLQQHQAELEYIRQAIDSGKTDVKEVKDDVYYVMMKEGTGRQVELTDTVVVHYKGYLLSDGTVFDQTRDRPATFPLNRLIRGWHIGVPLCKVGGKVKIVIPSALAYSIRTRSPKIPPNSILVFEVEVLEAKPKS